MTTTTAFSFSSRAIPGPRGGLFLGSILEFSRDPLGFLLRCAREYGDVFQVRLLHVPMVFFHHPRDIEVVLRTQSREFIKDSFTRGAVRLFGNGLLASEGEFWRRQRRLIAPALAHQQIQNYAETMARYTERMLDGWRPQEIRDIHKEMMGLTLQIVARCLFGIEIKHFVEEIGQALEVILDHYVNATSWLPALERLPTPGNLRTQRAIRRLDEIVFGIIKERRRQGGDDLLATLLRARDEDGRPMTDAQLRDETLTLLLAGHETTALALSYTFYLLAQNPGVEEKILEEASRVLGERTGGVEDLGRLPYTQAVLKESMRLYPPAWMIGREARRDCSIGGYFIPRGAQLAFAQWVVHRDPRFYKEPERFLPERWLDGLSERLPRCAYFPFGDGPRICVGNHFAMMEATILLIAILRRYRLRLVSEAPLSLIPSITIRPRGGIPVRLFRR